MNINTVFSLRWIWRTTFIKFGLRTFGVTHSVLTAWKVFVFGVILVRIFPYSDWIRTRITPNTNTFHVVVVFALKQIQNFKAVLNDCSNNHLKQPGITMKHLLLWAILIHLAITVTSTHLIRNVFITLIVHLWSSRAIK